VKQLIESKNEGRAGPKPEKVQRLAPVVDLMSALKKSLAEKGQEARATISKRLKRSA
jgi:non-homologous end joining protein Ku